MREQNCNSIYFKSVKSLLTGFRHFVPVDGFLSKRCDTNKDHDETEILSWEMDGKWSGTCMAPFCLI